MIELKMPNENWQLLQFKLYVGYFNRKLQEKSDNLFALTRRNTYSIGKTVLVNDKNPYPTFYSEFEELKQICLEREQKKLQINDEISKNMLKYNHSIDVANFGKNIAKDLKLFNNENLELLWSSFLLHDIGRFVQLSMTHTFKDYDSFERETSLSSLHLNNNKVLDHGELGRIILQNGRLIERFFPFNRSYDDFIGTIVGNHVKLDLPPSLSAKITNEKIYLDYSLKELIKNNKEAEVKQLIGWFIRILQDVDRLDILKQIERGDFCPKLSNEILIDDYPYELFYNGKYLNMHELKNKGLWNCNVGQLMRWSFIYQTNLVSVIKEIKNTGLISKIWEKQKINSLKSGYQFINALMDSLIETSPDGIYVDKEKALVKVKA